jgi:hypothetical protein
MTLKIKNIFFSILSVIILCMVTLSGLKAQAPVDEKAGAKAFVQQFYDQYSGLTNKQRNIAAAYFDKTLLDAYNMPFKKDDIGFDFDPISNAQDDRAGFQTGNVKQVGNKFFVDVHDVAKRKSEKEILAAPTCVIVETIRVGKSWKIANLIYPADKTSKQTDLLTLAAHHKKFGY